MWQRIDRVRVLIVCGFVIVAWAGRAIADPPLRFTLSCDVKTDERAHSDFRAGANSGQRVGEDGKMETLIISFEISGDRGRYWDFGRSVWNDLVKVTSDTLTLEKEGNASDQVGIQLVLFEISRVNGSYSYRQQRGFIEDSYVKNVRGECTKVAWRAPPAARF